jgi:hypothetical protein
MFLEIAKKVKSSYEWIERVVETPADNDILKALTEKARLDPLVIKCIDKKDVCISEYPSSFEQVLPRGVLKALRYSIRSSSDHNKLCKVYKVPPHIAIVMLFAKGDLEGSYYDPTRYACAPFIHPSVLRVLRLTEVVADYEVMLIIVMMFTSIYYNERYQKNKFYCIYIKHDKI